MKRAISALALLALPLAGCGGTSKSSGLKEGKCQISNPDAASDADGGATDALATLTCTPDFDALASVPIDADLPGARSVKVILDTADHDKLYFINSNLYKVHYDYASTHLSGNGLPIVPTLADFNTAEYYSPSRRFILAAVTYYEQPKVWALELAPYDTASATMMTTLFDAVQAATWFGSALEFHPTSDAITTEAQKLPSSIKVVSTDELYNQISYQPLVLATGVGRLLFSTVANLDLTTLSYQNIVVLDEAPNDIDVVQGLITQQFQSPLSHVNILSANRNTPNMGLRDALTNATLKQYDGQLVKLTVGAENWTVAPISEADAEAFWAAHAPTPITLPAKNDSVTALTDIADVTPEPATSTGLRQAIVDAVNIYGGKAAHYSILARTTDVPTLPAFAIPVYYYDQFFTNNGLFEQVDQMTADPDFVSDPTVRASRLADFVNTILTTPLDPDFVTAVRQKCTSEYAGYVMRFRTSTNSEDLAAFPCAGCYDSHSGDPTKDGSVDDAIREAWASAWQFRTFEERSYYGIDHKSVGMALLVHRHFEDETAGGVGITGNIFDDTGLDPAFYVNVTPGGDADVEHLPAGVLSDQFLYYFNEPNQPTTYIAHNNLISGNALTAKQIYTLGTAMNAIHNRFSPAYGPASGNNGWYAMDIEFKFDPQDTADGTPQLLVKQARFYPGRGSDVADDNGDDN